MSSPGTQDQAKMEKRSLLRELETVCISGWKIIALCTALGLIWAFVILRSSIYVYPVQMQATGVQSNSNDTQGNRISQLSGLASIANISLPASQGGQQFQLYIDSFLSRDLADDVARHQDIMQVLFATQWDAATQSWREPEKGIVGSLVGSMRDFLGLAPSAPWHAPDGASVYSYLSDNLTVFQDPRKTYLVRITLRTYDKAFGIRFLTFLNQVADDRLREKALTRANNYIGYLTDQLQNVTIAEHREAIAQSLSDQERYRMVAKSGSPFAAELFEHPWASNLPASPVPRSVILTWLIFGAGIGMSISYARLKWGRQLHGWLQSSRWVRHLPAFARRPFGL